jgi:hypothetical protein
MSIVVKTYATRGAARGAITAAKATWNPPPITFVNCTKQAQLLALVGPLQMATDAYELANGRFAVIADHPVFTGETIEESDIVRPPNPDLPPQANIAAKAKT